MKTNYIECVCQDASHVLRLSLLDLLFSDNQEYYLEVHLNGYFPWYKRIWLALSYVLGVQKTGAFDCTILNQDQADKLAILLSPELQSLHRTKLEVMKAIGRQIDKQSSEVTDDAENVE